MSDLCHCFQHFIAGGSDRCAHLGRPRLEAHPGPRVENKKPPESFLFEEGWGRTRQGLFVSVVRDYITEATTNEYAAS